MGDVPTLQKVKSKVGGIAYTQLIATTARNILAMWVSILEKATNALAMLIFIPGKPTN